MIKFLCGIHKSLIQFADCVDLSVDATDAVQARVRKRVVNLYKRKGLLTEEDAENIKSWKGSGGFSVNADVRIDSEDRKGLERLLRYCARPAFSGERLCAMSTFGENTDAMKLHYDVNKNSQERQAPLNLAATSLPYYECNKHNKILTHIGEFSESPKMHSARGPPDDCNHDDRFQNVYQHTLR